MLNTEQTDTRLKGDQQRGFAKMPNSVISSDLEMMAKIAYLALASFAWGTKAACDPGNDALARRMGCRAQAVIRSKRALVQKGLLKIARRGGNRTNSYELAGRDGGFTKIPNQVLDSELSTAAKMCYVALASFMRGGKGSCYPGNVALARRMGCHPRTAIRAKKELVAAGVLQVEGRGFKRSNRYRLNGITPSSPVELPRCPAINTTSKQTDHDEDTSYLAEDYVPSADRKLRKAPLDLSSDEAKVARGALLVGVDNPDQLVRSYSERFPAKLALAAKEIQHAQDCEKIRDPAAYVAAFLRSGPTNMSGARRFENHRDRVVTGAILERTRAREQGLAPPHSPQPGNATRWWYKHVEQNR